MPHYRPHKSLMFGPKECSTKTVPLVKSFSEIWDDLSYSVSVRGGSFTLWTVRGRPSPQDQELFGVLSRHDILRMIPFPMLRLINLYSEGLLLGSNSHQFTFTLIQWFSHLLIVVILRVSQQFCWDWGYVVYQGGHAQQSIALFLRRLSGYPLGWLTQDLVVLEKEKRLLLIICLQ